MEKKRDYLLPLSIVIAGLIIGGAVIYTNGLKVAQKNLPGNVVSNSNIKELNIQADEAIFGEKDAPLTLFEFSDYQCPFCARFHQLTRPELIKEYVNSGKLKMVFRDYPLHQYSLDAAEAAWCAKDQGKFWEMHDFIFEKAQESANALAKENLLNSVDKLGLNKLQFSNCLNSNKYQSRIIQSAKEAQSLGIRGTPTIIIAKKLPLRVDLEKVQMATNQGLYSINLDDGVMIIGAQANSVFKEAINKLLQ